MVLVGRRRFLVFFVFLLSRESHSYEDNRFYEATSARTQLQNRAAIIPAIKGWKPWPWKLSQTHGLDDYDGIEDFGSDEEYDDEYDDEYYDEDDENSETTEIETSDKITEEQSGNKGVKEKEKQKKNKNKKPKRKRGRKNNRRNKKKGNNKRRQNNNRRQKKKQSKNKNNANAQKKKKNNQETR